MKKDPTQGEGFYQIVKQGTTEVRTYHYETDEVDPVPEGVGVLDEVHDVRPALQGDDQEDGHPGQPDVVE